MRDHHRKVRRVALAVDSTPVDLAPRVAEHFGRAELRHLPYAADRIALSTGAATLPALLAFAKPGHTVFGSDWPFTPQAAVDQFTDGLDHYSGVDEAGRQAIDRDNAVALFSR